MDFEVFVSYSSKDKPIADAACHAIEASGVRCWIAPRDILPGSEWGASIVQAIARARAMVLIFSGAANASHQVTREAELAVNKGIPIIPVRIQDTMPTQSLEYFLSTPHWLDAFPPPVEAHFQLLVRSVHALTGVRQPLGSAPVPGPSPAPSPAAPSPATIGDALASQLAKRPDIMALARSDNALVKLNEALRQRGYTWITVATNTCIFGLSAAGDHVIARWTGPTYDMDIAFAVRIADDDVRVELLDCARIF